MNKKKILKISIIIIAIILGIIYIARNYIIRKDLNEKMEEALKSTNYSYILEMGDSSGKHSEVKTYYKEGIVVYKRIKDENVIGLTWQDTNNNETIYINYEERLARVDKPSNESNHVMPVSQAYSDFKLIPLTVNISQEENSGKKCYSLGAFTIDKENGTLVRMNYNGQYCNYKDWKFNEVTDEDVARPNLSELEVTTKIIS